MPLLCKVFRIHVSCESLSHFFRVKSRAVWGHPACFKCLIYLKYGQYPPFTHTLGKVVPPPGVGGSISLRMDGFITQPISFTESPCVSIQMCMTSLLTGGVSEEKGDLDG